MDPPHNAHFRFRRIGKPATKPNVGNVFKLTGSVTKFGRHSGNDNFIDSAELDCFISRWHAEVHRIVHKGQVHYVLKDKSLNGTYVNNHRVQGNHVLQPGEIVCFGHTNGKNLKPGDYAPQTDSEFEFMFEKEPLDSDVEIIGEDRHGCSPQPVHSTTDFNGLSTLSEMATLGHHDMTKAVSLPEVESSHTVNVSRTGSSQMEHARQRISPVLDDIVNKSPPRNPPSLVPFEEIAAQASSGRVVTSCNITVQVAQDKVFAPSPPSADTTSRITAPTSSRPTATTSSRPTATTSSRPTAATTSRPTVESTSPPTVDTTSQQHAVSVEAGKERGQKDRKKMKKQQMSGPAKKKTKVSGNSRKRATSTDDDNDTWHYEGDKCDAYNCSRPVGDKVSWVQCDDCDAWYHVQCAGCNYDKVKKKKEEFHCGCV